MTIIIDEAADITREEWRHMSDAVSLMFSYGATYQGLAREKGDSLADRLMAEFYDFSKPEDKP